MVPMKTFFDMAYSILCFLNLMEKLVGGTGMAGTRENRGGRKETRYGERKDEKQKF